MGRPLTWQDDLDLYVVPEIEDMHAPTADEINEGHRMREVMANGFEPNPQQNTVTAELLREGKTASTIGSEQYQPQLTVRLMDADNDDLDSLERGEMVYLVAVPAGGGEDVEEGTRADVWRVRSQGPAMTNSTNDAFVTRQIGLPAEDWAIDVEVASQ